MNPVLLLVLVQAAAVFGEESSAYWMEISAQQPNYQGWQGQQYPSGNFPSILVYQMIFSGECPTAQRGDS